MINNKKNKVRGQFVIFMSSFFKALIIVTLLGGIAYASYVFVSQNQRKSKPGQKEQGTGIEIVDKYKGVEGDALRELEKKLGNVLK